MEGRTLPSSPAGNDHAGYARPRFFARITKTPADVPLPQDEWQSLENHLSAVAGFAEEFASKFGAAEWGRLAGIWHDLGKFHPDFQQMLRDVARGGKKHRVDHSTAGAIHAAQMLETSLNKGVGRERGKFLLLAIMAAIGGHHGGLPEGPAELRARAEEKKDLYKEVLLQHIPEVVLIPTRKLPSLPSRLGKADPGEWKLRVEFFARMLLSVLVDADRLDAERAGEVALPGTNRPSALRRSYATIESLREALDSFIDRKVAALPVEAMGTSEGFVFRYRQTVLRSCREAASLPPGAFKLDVATGGGKTLSSLSFALRHAEIHKMRRVIVVIPFTSIVEQTAAEYREGLGSLASNVVEHHSAINDSFERTDDDQLSGDPSLRRRHLATENWDAPLIVTTAVQFFESLFSSSPSRCRKLHNIAGSVVILDEAQTLPPSLLNPTVWAMNELVEGYRATLVLSTATQPSLEPPFPEVRNVRPIVPESEKIPAPRVRLEVDTREPIPWDRLASDLAQHRQVLCITHKRDDARELAQELDRVLGDKTTFHLSANMCPAHRAREIRRIRTALATGAVCRVASTQLVEAGVDLDFPVVCRALAGIDSLIQAAGRANREGRLGDRGGVLRVYRAVTEPPPGLPRLAADAAETLLRSAEMDACPLDLFSHETARTYFRHYFEKIDDKDGGITPLRAELRYHDVAARFRFIRDADLSVIVPFDDRAAGTLRECEMVGPSRDRLRTLQRYAISLYPRTLWKLRDTGRLTEILPPGAGGEGGLYALHEALGGVYDDRFGFDPSAVEDIPPGELTV